MKEKETNTEKRKTKRKKIHSALCIVAIIAILSTLIVVPSLALQGGGATEVTDLYTTLFPSAVLEQVYTDKYASNTLFQYENQFSLPIPRRTIDRFDSGVGIFVPNYNGLNQTGIQTDYTISRRDYQGATIYSTDYSFNINPSRTNIGMPPTVGFYNTNNGFANFYLGDFNGVSTPLPSDILDDEYGIEMRYLVHQDADIVYDGYDIGDQYRVVFINFETYSTVNGIIVPSEHSIRVLLTSYSEPIGTIGDYDIYEHSMLYPLAEIYDYLDERVALGNIRVSYTVNRYTPDGELVPAAHVLEEEVLCYGFTVHSMMVPFDSFYPPAVLNGNGTFVDSSFNPIDWVVNVGETFLGMSLFNTVAGVPVTIGVLFGAIVVTFSILAILKLYWGG